MSGCGKAPPDQQQTNQGKRPDEILPSQTVHVKPGSLTQFREKPKHERAWDVKWQEADVNYVQGRQPGGDMKSVSGTIFKNDKGASNFSADKGHAEQGTGVLSLNGNVQLQSKDLGINVSAGSVVWDASKQVIVAKGDVSLSEKGYTLAGVKELWCTPDLKFVSTPDQFKKP